MRVRAKVDEDGARARVAHGDCHPCPPHRDGPQAPRDGRNQTDGAPAPDRHNGTPRHAPRDCHPCPPPMHGGPDGPRHGPRNTPPPHNGTDRPPRNASEPTARDPDGTPRDAPRNGPRDGPCQPCPPPHARAGARVDADAEVGLRAKLALMRPCSPPCPPVEARVAADARADPDAVRVDARAGLRLGEGCRHGPGDPHAPHMRAARRAHAVDRALDGLDDRLRLLESHLERTVLALAEDVDPDTAAKLERRLAQLERMQDHLLERFSQLVAGLEGLRERWDEPDARVEGRAEAHADGRAHARADGRANLDGDA